MDGHKQGDAARGADAYPAVLDDGEGCIFGRAARTKAAGHEQRREERVDGLEKKVDRLMWALLAAAVAFTANLLRAVVLR